MASDGPNVERGLSNTWISNIFLNSVPQDAKHPTMKGDGSMSSSNEPGTLREDVAATVPWYKEISGINGRSSLQRVWVTAWRPWI